MARRGKGKGKNRGKSKKNRARRRQHQEREIRRAVTAVAQLFEEQPGDEDELEQRLDGLDHEVVGAALVAWLEDGQLAPGDEELYLAALAALGPARPTAALERLLRDPDAPLALRGLAGEALGPEALGPLLPTLPEEAAAAVMLGPPMRLMHRVKAEPEAAEVVAEILEQLLPEQREGMLYTLGHQRRQVGAPAALAWAAALRRPQLAALHPVMRDAVVAEGGPVGQALLRELAADDPAAAAALEQLRAGVVPGESVPAVPQGQAFLGNCDGQGGFAVLALLENPDRTTTLTSVCVRAGAGLRVGLVDPRFDPARRDHYFEMLLEEGGTALHPLPLERAACLLVRALRRTERMERDLPDGTREALALLCRGAPLGPQGEDELPALPRPPPAAPPTLEQVNELLERPEYTAWFFDEEDLEPAGVELPDELDCPPPGWFAGAAAALARRPAVVARLERILEHQGRWHALGGQREDAALCAGLLQQLKAGFAVSPLVRGMLEVTLEVAELAEDDAMWDPLGEDDDRLELLEDEDGGLAPSPADRPHLRLLHRLLQEASRREWGRMALRRALGDSGPGSAEWERDLTQAYVCYGWTNSKGERLVDLFAREEPALPADEAPYLEALREARFSLWEVQQVRLDQGLELVDTLLGDRLFVRERSATHQLKRYDLLLAWVIEPGQHRELGAVAVVPPAHRDTVRRAARQELERERRKHPERTELEQLRQVAGPLQRTLRRAVEIWRHTGPRIVNMDREETVFCQAVFELSDRAGALGRLGGREDFEVDAEAGQALWLDPAGRPQLPGPLHLGRLVLSEQRLVLETSSRERLARGKQLLGQLLQGLARHRVDTVQDLDVALAEQRERGAPPEAEIPEEVQAELLSAYLQDHLTRWIDMPLPALDGKTPRQAARSAAGRRRVDELLKGQENLAQSMAGGDRVDFDAIRRELGLR